MECSGQSWSPPNIHGLISMSVTSIRNKTKCGVNVFKSELDTFLSQLPDNLCTANVDNSIAGTVLVFTV